MLYGSFLMLTLVWRPLTRVLISGLIALLATGAAAASDRDFVLAAQLDNPSKVKQLLGEGASPNLVDPLSGETVLIIAVREGADRVVDVLLAQKELDLERTAPNGNTALMMAAFKGNKRVVQLLLDKNAIVTRPGWTALHFAAAGGDEAVIRLLLDHYAYIDAESPSKLTPLMIAAREGQEGAVKLLLREGADATLKNNENLTAAQIAERADKPRIADAIMAHLATRKRAALD